MTSLTVCSLFSGAGGMDLGIEGGFELPDAPSPTYYPRTRFKTVFANDILPYAKTAWTGFFTPRGTDPSIYRVGSIVDLINTHLSDGGVFPDTVDLLTGGFPCQDFSTAGKRNGFNSHRNHDGTTGQPTKGENRGELYLWLGKAIEIMKPKMFIAENVKGLTTMPGAKETIETALSNIDNKAYHVFAPKVLNAANYGVPQNRERVFFIGVRKEAMNPHALQKLETNKGTDNPSSFSPYPTPQYGQYKHFPASVPMRVFHGLDEPEWSNDPDQQAYSKAKYYGSHCQGNKEIDLLAPAPTIRAEHHGSIEFRRLSKEHGGNNSIELSCGLPERRLTVRECALLQTFPTGYQFIQPSRDGLPAVSMSNAYRLIGNAVPPLLAYRFASKAQSIWDTYFQ